MRKKELPMFVVFFFFFALLAVFLLCNVTIGNNFSTGHFSLSPLVRVLYVLTGLIQIKLVKWCWFLQNRQTEIKLYILLLLKPFSCLSHTFGSKKTLIITLIVVQTVTELCRCSPPHVLFNYTLDPLSLQSQNEVWSHRVCLILCSKTYCWIIFQAMT